MPSFYQPIGKVALAGLFSAAAASAFSLLDAPAAHALIACLANPNPVPAYDPDASCLVTIDSQTWEIKTTTGVFGSGIVNGISLLETPWWPPVPIAPAQIFSESVGLGLGTPSALDVPGTFAPFFAFSEGTSAPQAYACNSANSTCDTRSIGAATNGTWAYAIRQPSTTSVPAPLPVLGAATAFGVSRRIRRRLRGA